MSRQAAHLLVLHPQDRFAADSALTLAGFALIEVPEGAGAVTPERHVVAVREARFGDPSEVSDVRTAAQLAGKLQRQLRDLRAMSALMLSAYAVVAAFTYLGVLSFAMPDALVVLAVGCLELAAVELFVHLVRNPRRTS